MKVLLYEGGEALRFDEAAIDAAVKGCLRVMAAIGMITDGPRRPAHAEPALSTSSSWVRAPESGILHTNRRIGDRVGRSEVIGVVADPLGTQSRSASSRRATASSSGAPICPSCNRGDALFHIARSKPAASKAKAKSDAGDPLYDEDEII